MLETEQIDYPDSDGVPVSDNTWQAEWIARLMWNAACLFKKRDDVFVASDHLIYPVKGQPKIRFAPDAYVAFGVRKRHRGSYKVWLEGDVFPQVVFEVYSPGNSQPEFESKLGFHEKYGAEEYYVIHPDDPSTIVGYRRDGARLIEIPNMNGFVSPRLGIRFVVEDDDIDVLGPDGNRWLAPHERAEELEEQRLKAERKAATAERRAATAQRRADLANARELETRTRNEALSAKLRAAGIDPDIE